jgi:hypothetical protein
MASNGAASNGAPAAEAQQSEPAAVPPTPAGAGSSGAVDQVAAASTAAAEAAPASATASLRPFAVVDDVADDSPAAEAGIQLVCGRVRPPCAYPGPTRAKAASGCGALPRRRAHSPARLPCVAVSGCSSAAASPATAPHPLWPPQGDQLCRFGDVTLGPMPGDELARVAAALQRHEGTSVEVIFLRHGAPVTIALTPRRWAGRGLLGCHLRPLGRNM